MSSSTDRPPWVERFEELEDRVAALEEQIAALTTPGGGQVIVMYRCRSCKLLFGKREGWEPSKCPYCGRGAPLAVDGIVTAVTEGDDGS